jgi:hypothetical protein
LMCAIIEVIPYSVDNIRFANVEKAIALQENILGSTFD